MSEFKHSLINLQGTPGTRFVQNVQDFMKSSGVISAKTKGGASTIGDFSSWRSQFPSVWNGVPLFDVTVQGRQNGDAYLWARYAYQKGGGGGGGGSSFTGFTIDTGTDDVLLWNDYESGTAPYREHGKVTQRRVQAQVANISWGNEVTRAPAPDHLPADIRDVGGPYVSTINSNGYQINGISFPKFSLLMQAPTVRVIKIRNNNYTIRYWYNARFRSYSPYIGASTMEHWSQSIPGPPETTFKTPHASRDWPRFS